MTKKVLVLLLVFLTSLTVAQLDRSIVPDAGPAPEIKIGDIESFQLDNGLKVFVVENDKLPRVTFSVILNRNPIQEGENKGYVGITGELLGTYTENRTKEQLNEEIDFIGATLNTGSASMYGAALSKHKEKLFELAADVFLNPVFKQEELDKIVKQTLSGLQAAKESPSAIADNVRRALVYGKDHPYGEIETENTVKNVTLEMCENYYKTYFKPNIAYMAIVGDISVSEAEDLAEEYFGKWEKADVPKHEYKTPKKPIIRKVALVDRSTSVQSVINVTYPLDLPKGHEDLVAVSVMNELLGGNFSSRFMQNLREDKAFTYGARSAISSDKLVGSFRAYCEARNAVTDSAVTEFLYEMQRMIDDPISDKELVATKNYLSGSFARSLESPQTVANFAINIERYGLASDYYSNYLKRLSAVTIADVQKVAKKYLKPSNSYVLVVGNGEDVAENLKQFSPAFKVKYYDNEANKVDPAAKLIPEGLTAEDVLKKYMKATNYEKLKEVNAISTEMSADMSGMTINVLAVKKKPNKFYTEITLPMGKQEIVFDGEKGKMSMMGNDMPMQDSQIETFKLLGGIDALYHLKENGISTELSGAEKIDGSLAYKIKYIMPSGAEKVEFYDAESGYKVRDVSVSEGPQGKTTQTISFTDYKEVGGVMMPHSQSVQMGPQTITMIVSKIEFNTNPADEKFIVK